MRIFNNTHELLSEAKRDLFEMWKIIKTYSMQNKIVIDDVNFQTHELQNYQFMLNDIDDLSWAFKYREFIFAELQRIFEYAKEKWFEKMIEDYKETFNHVKSNMTSKLEEYKLFDVITYISREEYDSMTWEKIASYLELLKKYYSEYYLKTENTNIWYTFKDFVKTINDSEYAQIYNIISLVLNYWTLFDFQERVDKSWTVNPWEAYKLRPWVWEKFIEKEWKFWYTYNERIVWKRNKLYKLIEEIKKHPTSRQLNLPIFEDAVDYDNFWWGSRVPCSLHYNFLIRPTWERKSRREENTNSEHYKELWNWQEFEISIAYSMRSCDYLTHFAIDYVQAINLLRYVREQVKDSINLKLWHLFYTAYSFHAYNKDLVEHVF